MDEKNKICGLLNEILQQSKKVQRNKENTNLWYKRKQCASYKTFQHYPLCSISSILRLFFTKLLETEVYNQTSQRTHFETSSLPSFSSSIGCPQSFDCSAWYSKILILCKYSHLKILRIGLEKSSVTSKTFSNFTNSLDSSPFKPAFFGLLLTEYVETTFRDRIAP